jgi:hypothetical protein
MRATTAVIAITAVVAVAAVAVTISRFSVDGGPTQLGSAGIVVTPATVDTAAPAVPSPGALPGGGPATNAAEPDGSVARGGPGSASGSGSGANDEPSSSAHPVAPAPARTLPSQAATGKPGSPGKSGDHASR